MANKRSFDLIDTGERFIDGKNKKQKVEALNERNVGASHRVSTLARLCYEVQHDENFAQELSTFAGENLKEATLNLGKAFSSIPSLLSSILGDKPSSFQNLPAVPSTELHLSVSSNSLPPIPPIQDPSLATIPFTHRGTLHNTLSPSPTASYERLEYLGDAYLEIIASRLLYQSFPSMTAGKLSKTRELLVKNETLAEFSLAYSFDTKASLPKAYKEGREHRKIWTKMLGDMFEAYVAAVILSSPATGFQTAEKWLVALWTPLLSTPDPSTTFSLQDAPFNPSAKLQLQQKLGGKGIKLSYRPSCAPIPIKGGHIYSISVFLDGWGYPQQLLGEGKGESTKEAGNRAAMRALLNPVTAHAGAVKRDFDEQVKEERKREEEEKREGEGEEEQERKQEKRKRQEQEVLKRIEKQEEEWEESIKGPGEETDLERETNIVRLIWDMVSKHLEKEQWFTWESSESPKWQKRAQTLMKDKIEKIERVCFMTAANLIKEEREKRRVAKGIRERGR